MKGINLKTWQLSIVLWYLIRWQKWNIGLFHLQRRVTTLDDTFVLLCRNDLFLMFVCAATFRDLDVLSLAKALKQLSESSRSSLTDLSISVLPYTKLVEILLDASPNVTSLHVEIQTVMWGPRFLPHYPRTAESDMPGALTLLPKWSNCSLVKWAEVYCTC